MKQYDAIIIGFGKGGKLLAVELANRNWRVAIIERSPQMYGGTSVNVGYTPTESLIHESIYTERLYRDNYEKQCKHYALAICRKNKLTSYLRQANHEGIITHPNITLYDGVASFISANSIKVTSNTEKDIYLIGKEIFINTGSTPIIPDIIGVNSSKYIYTSETILQQKKLPPRLLILGAGPIGLELATMYAGFGSKVVLLEARSRFLPKIDQDISQFVLDSFKRKRIDVRLDVHALSVTDKPSGVTLTYTDSFANVPHSIEGDALLLATGRRPAIDELDLHLAGVKTDAQGAIIVDSQLHTTAPHIWALGDVRGGAMYDYLSVDDFRIITNQLFGNKIRCLEDRNPVCNVVFTDPPLAHIGITEEEAMKRGYAIKVSHLPAVVIPRVRTLQSIDGVMKAIVNSHTGHIIGCTLFCEDAAEVINWMSLAMKSGQSPQFVRDFVFTHPSVSEGLNELFKSF